MSHVVDATRLLARNYCVRDGPVRSALITMIVAPIFWCHAASSTPTDTSSLAKVALVIGNADYDAVQSLPNPANDAHDMCAMLGAIGFKASCYVNVKTRAQLKSFIQDFVESLPDDAVTVVYYAGHAVQVNGENYLIPTGAQLRTEGAVVDEAVNLSYLMRQLGQTRDYLNLVILDACRDNPLPASVTSHAQGLAQVVGFPNGTVVWYAADANASALDGTGRNGILTKNILAHIRDPGTIDETFRAINSGVQKDALAFGRTQRPAAYGNFGGQYCLVECTTVEKANKKVAELEARAAAGEQVQADLIAAKAQLAKTEADQKKKDEAAAKKAEREERDRQRNGIVVPGS